MSGQAVKPRAACLSIRIRGRSLMGESPGPLPPAGRLALAWGPSPEEEPQMSGTATVHHAELKPTKLELLAQWLPSQPWFEGDAHDLERVGAYRFVDPDGEVGIETLLVRSGGLTYQVPLTYRAEPLEDAGSYLIGTLEHSVLGSRYVYDAVGDPVYVAELIRVIHEADNEADLSQGEKSMSVLGSGITAVSNAAMQAARLIRVLDGAHNHTAIPLGILEGTWAEDGHERNEVLATIR